MTCALPIEPYLTHAETARVLRVSPKTLYQMNWNGTGPSRYKVGRYCRYDVAEVRAWLADRMKA